MYKWLIGLAIIVLVAVVFWRLHGFQLLRDGGRDVAPSADFGSLEEATLPGDGTLSGSESGSISTPSGSAQAGKSITLTLTFNGAERSYILHVPTVYTSTKKYPLMISYHGEGGS